MEGRNRGADAVIAALAAAGVRRIFTLSGNHVMSLYDAAFDARIELVHVRQELAAVHMADAWGRLTGEAGVALVTGGPGHANAVSALYGATLAESPVLLLSGHAPTDQLGMGAFQEMRQADVAAPLTKASWTASSAAEVGADVTKAIAIATSGRRGAVHLSLPTDLLEGPAPRLDAPASVASRSAPIDPDPFLRRLSQARKPIVVTGPAGLTKAGRARAARLEAACGVPVVGMESPRGLLDPSLGAFARALREADCVLLLGKRLDFTLKFGRPPAISPACEFLQIDSDESEIERTRRAVGGRLRLHAIAPLFEAMDALADAGASKGRDWLEEVRAAIAYRPPEWKDAKSSGAGRLHPLEVLRPLQRVLDSHPDSVAVLDGGEFGQWALASLRAPNRVMNGVGGPIGVALPFASAARLAKPGVPVIAVMGDGTFGFLPAEIDTAVRYELPYVAVVGNDARWNAEYQIQVREYGAARAIGTDLLPTRYDEVAKGFGAYGELVDDRAQLPAALERALASGRPAVLNVIIEGVPAPTIGVP